ncbi:EPIDERMAL PATTERNING FACTOR-like protein 4 [Striga hermonthica]|uniref:Epidermal patterning factor-like protein n=1 Tax=Striga hermonthica TaxID=68872 RepID=A0A9N7R689_STRHE|nr:EPIDERMAL PATTERNING FACTOR-like protein 4 [Striga hermonthica]
MGTRHNRRRRREWLSFATAAVALLLLLSSVSGAYLRLSPSRQLSSEGGPARRRLGVPGSSPPTCRSRCGRCAPCDPVHVPVQPGFSMPLEYYPEAWRCKCGNKLFMP